MRLRYRLIMIALCVAALLAATGCQERTRLERLLPADTFSLVYSPSCDALEEGARTAFGGLYDLLSRGTPDLVPFTFLGLSAGSDLSLDWLDRSRPLGIAIVTPKTEESPGDRLIFLPTLGGREWNGEFDAVVGASDSIVDYVFVEPYVVFMTDEARAGDFPPREHLDLRAYLPPDPGVLSIAFNTDEVRRRIRLSLLESRKEAAPADTAGLLRALATFADRYVRDLTALNVTFGGAADGARLRSNIVFAPGSEAAELCAAFAGASWNPSPLPLEGTAAGAWNVGPALVDAVMALSQELSRSLVSGAPSRELLDASRRFAGLYGPRGAFSMDFDLSGFMSLVTGQQPNHLFDLAYAIETADWEGFRNGYPELMSEGLRTLARNVTSEIDIRHERDQSLDGFLYDRISILAPGYWETILGEGGGSPGAGSDGAVATNAYSGFMRSMYEEMYVHYEAPFAYLAFGRNGAQQLRDLVAARPTGTDSPLATLRAGSGAASAGSVVFSLRFGDLLGAVLAGALAQTGLQPGTGSMDGLGPEAALWLRGSANGIVAEAIWTRASIDATAGLMALIVQTARQAGEGSDR